MLSEANIFDWSRRLRPAALQLRFAQNDKVVFLVRGRKLSVTLANSIDPTLLGYFRAPSTALTHTRATKYLAGSIRRHASLAY